AAVQVLQSRVEASPWRRAQGLGVSLTEFAPEQIPAVISLADRFGHPGQADERKFAELAVQIGFDHQENHLAHVLRLPVEAPAAWILRLFRFLALADRVFDEPPASLADLTSLRRLTDLIRASRGW